MNITVPPSVRELPDAAFNNKRVLMRADFNVPLNKDGTIANDNRIEQTLPTINYLLDRNARLVLMSHLGRPDGAPDPKYSMKPVAERLQQLLPKRNVRFVDQVVGPKATEAVNNLNQGDVLVLENVRFEPGETKNDPAFAKQLGDMGDVYVNDAFGAAHRAHASTEGVARQMDTKAAGLLMTKELSSFSRLMKQPEGPFTAILGGGKVSTKIDVLNQLLPLVDKLVIGGAMAFTLLKAQGKEVGKSLVEPDFIDTAKEFLEAARQKNTQVILPTDFVVAKEFKADSPNQTVSADAIPADQMGLDIGPKTAEAIKAVIDDSKTVFWNGPLGVFEFDAFAEGTRQVASHMSKRTQSGKLTSVLGGGDTQAAVEKFGIKDDTFTHVSTGGGASLELLEGKTLPGVAVLMPQPAASI